MAPPAHVGSTTYEGRLLVEVATERDHGSHHGNAVSAESTLRGTAIRVRFASASWITSRSLADQRQDDPASLKRNSFLGAWQTDLEENERRISHPHIITGQKKEDVTCQGWAATIRGRGHSRRLAHVELGHVANRDRRAGRRHQAGGCNACAVQEKLEHLKHIDGFMVQMRGGGERGQGLWTSVELKNHTKYQVP